MNNKTLFDRAHYNDAFFAWHMRYAHNYSLLGGRRLFTHFKPGSVVDFGCGIGSYLLAAHKCGIGTLAGYDIGGAHARKYAAREVAPFINFDTDITQQITFKQPYDMSICIEVAEHIEPSGSNQLVKNISEATLGMCVWTAAPPGQEGCAHINCRPQEEWVALFSTHGMDRSIVFEKRVRELFYDSPRYILDNLRVFV